MQSKLVLAMGRAVGRSLRPTTKQPDHPPHPAEDPEPDASAPDAAATPDAATPEWTRTLLDPGAGWTREVLRHLSSPAGGNGSVPGAAAR